MTHGQCEEENTKIAEVWHADGSDCNISGMGGTPQRFWKQLSCWLVSSSQTARCGIYGSNCPEWFMAMEVRTLYSIFHDRCLVRRALIYHGLHLFSSWNTELRYFPLDSCLQACNGHSVVCVPLYDTLGITHLFLTWVLSFWTSITLGFKEEEITLH
jgi:hypothetical protein